MAHVGPTRTKAGGEAADFKPFVPAEAQLSEITVKAVLLGILLAMLLGSANVYLGLFAGLTVATSIPAAVISMSVLRLFPKRSILENNIVQTAASAGGSLSAGVIFTIPAMVLLGIWEDFSSHALETILIATFAGILGVMFTIPLRRAFIVDAKLQFPEGVACGEVLEAGEEGGEGAKLIGLGALVGGLVKVGEAGWQLWLPAFDWATRAGRALIPFGSNLSPALVGVGYIVGTNIAIVIFLGGVISWLVGMPIYTIINGLPSDLDTAQELAGYSGALWSTQIRYMGVGAMAVGGLYAIFRLAKPLARGIKNGFDAYREIRAKGTDTRVRTEQDLPIVFVAATVGVALLPLIWIYADFSESIPRALLLGVMMLIVGFLFSSVAGYMSGLVGSSNNPVSGVTIATTLVVGGTLWLTGISDELGPIATVAAAATIASAAAIAGDNLQDLKTGYLVGATPRRQQVMLLVGVASVAVVTPLILEILNDSYGFCGVEGASDRCLAAPQANLIGSVSAAFFGTSIPWGMAGIGAAIAVAIIAVDITLERTGSGFRMPVLAVAVGIYLPLALTTAIFIGGMIHFLVARTHARRERLFADREQRAARGLRNGLLFASGLIAGEAILGILLGIPLLPVFAGEDGGNPLAYGHGLPGPYPFSGALILLYVGILMWYIAVRPFIARVREV